MHNNAVGGTDNARAIRAVPAVYQNRLGSMMNDEQAVYEVFLRDLAGGKFETVQMRSCMFGFIVITVIFPQVQNRFEP